MIIPSAKCIVVLAFCLLFVLVFIYLFIYLFIHQEPTDIPSRTNLMRWVCARRGSLLLDHLPAKFNYPKLKNEMIVRIGMKHSFFSNYLFAINFFMLLKLLLFAKN